MHAGQRMVCVPWRLILQVGRLVHGRTSWFVLGFTNDFRMNFMGVTCPRVVRWLLAAHKMKINVLMFSPKPDITANELATIMQWRLEMSAREDVEAMRSGMPSEALRHFVLHEFPKAGGENQSRSMLWLSSLRNRISCLWRLLLGQPVESDMCRARHDESLEAAQTTTTGGHQ